MINASKIQAHAEIIGSDGVHVGTVDRVEGSRIKLTKADSQAGHKDHHHFIELDVVDTVQENRVHLSISSAEVLSREEEQDGRSVH